MSALRTLDIKCDAEGCLEWTEGDGSNQIHSARRAAHQRGWTTRRSSDYCPFHRVNPLRRVEGDREFGRIPIGMCPKCDEEWRYAGCLEEREERIESGYYGGGTDTYRPYRVAVFPLKAGD